MYFDLMHFLLNLTENMIEVWLSMYGHWQCSWAISSSKSKGQILISFTAVHKSGSKGLFQDYSYTKVEEI